MLPDSMAVEKEITKKIGEEKSHTQWLRVSKLLHELLLWAIPYTHWHWLICFITTQISCRVLDPFVVLHVIQIPHNQNVRKWREREKKIMRLSLSALLHVWIWGAFAICMPLRWSNRVWLESPRIASDTRTISLLVCIVFREHFGRRLFSKYHMNPMTIS